MILSDITNFYHIEDYVTFCARIDNSEDYYDFTVKFKDYDFRKTNESGKRIWEISKFLGDKPINIIINAYETKSPYDLFLSEKVEMNFADIKNKYGITFYEKLYELKEE